jgi:branched-chain amino acid transport system ATP-binding protein
VSDAAPLLELSGVSVHFAGLRALTDVHFVARPGEVKAVIGPNGAGKTTLFNVISGFVTPTAGTVRFRGEAIQTLTPHEISAKGVRRTFQNGGLFGDMTALENVLAGLHSQIGSSLLGLLFDGRAAREAELAALERARKLMRLMEIEHLSDHLARDLSGGQQRMVEIVRALATDPPLLLLDEPAVGLAPPVRERLMQIVRRLAGEEGISILLIEHAIEFVMQAADVIAVFNAGQKIAEGSPAEVRENRDVLEAYLGHA